MFLCSCAGTLDEHLDLEEVARRIADLPGAEVAEVCPVLCSPDGLDRLAGEVASRGWERVVIGACTPGEHGAAFRAAVARGGVDPYLTAVANLREQCAWVGEDRERTVEKACDLVTAAVARVREQLPLEVRATPARTGVAVVGGGPAGVAAALALADGGREVVLVERAHALGGRAYRYEELYPERECGACRLAPPLDEVLHHPGIRVTTGASVVRCRGREGDFRLDLAVAPRGVDVTLCLGCGACGAACPATGTGPADSPAIRPVFDGALPHAPVVDPTLCRRCLGETCDACVAACPTGAARPGEAGEARELEVGAVVLAPGFGWFDPAATSRFGYPGNGRVWTAPELELRLAAAAAGDAPLEVCGAAPRRVALVHCVGSRSERFHPHCSGICCAYLGKHAAQLAALLPGVEVVDLNVDHCLPGRREEHLFRSCLREAGATLRRRRSADEVELLPGPDGVRVRYARPDGIWDEETVDLAILAPALLGAEGAGELAGVFGIRVTAGGWFEEGAELLARNTSERPGVLLAGACRSPGDVGQAVADGLTAAGQVFRTLVPGRILELSPEVAVVDPDRCSGCGVCRVACEYGAVALDEGRVAGVDETLCRGCGTCAVACPAGAVEQRHSTDAQLLAEAGPLLRGQRR